MSSWDPDGETHAFQVTMYNISFVKIAQSFDSARELGGPQQAAKSM